MNRSSKGCRALHPGSAPSWGVSAQPFWARIVTAFMKFLMCTSARKDTADLRM
jgi:hypothetical protein